MSGKLRATSKATNKDQQDTNTPPNTYQCPYYLLLVVTRGGGPVDEMALNLMWLLICQLLYTVGPTSLLVATYCRLARLV